MRGRPLPAELGRFDNLPDLTYRGGSEWSAACPRCGGADRARGDRSDRLRLFAASNGNNARVWCRRCNWFEWADENEAPDPVQIAQARALQAQLAQQEEQRLQRKITALQDAAYWRGWHDAMTQQQRQLWHQQGVIDYFIDYYSLGYNPDYTYNHAGLEYHSPSMTIPHYATEWELVNVQHRLMQPVNGAGKYRQMHGLPAAMFRTEPDEPLTNAVMVVEGAKKAIVTYTHLGEKPLGFNMHIVGIPSKYPSGDMLELLADADPVYLLLDPDAYHSERGEVPSVNRVASKLGRERVRIVKTPCKPDDLFTQYGGTAEDLRSFLRMAVVA